MKSSVKLTSYRHVPRQAGFHVSINPSAHDPEWDSFVERQQCANHEQSTLWGLIKTIKGWQAYHLSVKKRGSLVGGAIILIRKIPYLGYIGYISRGPVFTDDSEAQKETLFAIERWAKHVCLLYLVIVPPFFRDSLVPELIRMGFREKPVNLPPSGLVEATFLIDLTRDLDSILA